jgi:transcriptional regulator with GAF, ATPase, and Fis domain
MQEARLSSGALAGVDRSDLPEEIRRLSIAQWGERQATVLVGRDERLIDELQKVVRFAGSESPVLVTGETGTGKELFARALYLASSLTKKPFLRINCAQYTSEQLIVSELFGHKKGSFTGAIADHRGIFEEANGGCVLLDEVGELPIGAQAVLLRLLGEGEIVPVGGCHPKTVDVRIVAATSRDLSEMVSAGKFRADLFYRLRYLQVFVPPVRDRGNDWELIARYYLERLCRKHGASKTLSTETIRELRQHAWPGNVREVKSCVETGFHACHGNAIAPCDLADALEVGAREDQARKVSFKNVAIERCARMVGGDEGFWDAIYQPFMERDLNRAEVREVLAEGLRLAGGSYKNLLDCFGIEPDDYLKFMDFLRHHKLKPERPRHSRGTHAGNGTRPHMAAVAAGG